jgi:hypothetical protein
MATLEVQVSQADYARASTFLVSHLRRLGQRPTSLLPWSIIATMLYSTPLFVIVVAPNGLDDHTRTVLRASVLALLLVPALFVFGVYRLRRADARALQPLAPPPSERIAMEATAAELRIETEAFKTTLPWSSAAVFVVDDEFAVVLAPRMAPFPVTKAGSASPEQFYLFLRHAQQYKAASAA